MKNNIDYTFANGNGGAVGQHKITN